MSLGQSEFARSRLDSLAAHHRPHPGAGVSAQVTSIQGINTKGGHAFPAAASCDSSKLDAETKIPCTADYYFYAPAK